MGCRLRPETISPLFANLSSTTHALRLCQNRRQTVFNKGLCISEGGFGFVRGLDTQKFTKTQLIYSVSCFNLGGLELRLGGLAPKSPPVATELDCVSRKVTLSETTAFILSVKSDQRKRLPHWLYYQFQ